MAKYAYHCIKLAYDSQPAELLCPKLQLFAARALWSAKLPRTSTLPRFRPAGANLRSPTGWRASTSLCACVVCKPCVNSRDPASQILSQSKARREPAMCRAHARERTRSRSPDGSFPEVDLWADCCRSSPTPVVLSQLVDEAVPWLHFTACPGSWCIVPSDGPYWRRRPDALNRFR